MTTVLLRAAFDDVTGLLVGDADDAAEAVTTATVELEALTTFEVDVGTGAFTEEKTDDLTAVFKVVATPDWLEAGFEDVVGLTVEVEAGFEDVVGFASEVDETLTVAVGLTDVVAAALLLEFTVLEEPAELDASDEPSLGPDTVVVKLPLSM